MSGRRRSTSEGSPTATGAKRENISGAAASVVLVAVAALAVAVLEALAAFERENVDPGEEARERIQSTLEEGGAVFLTEADGGIGVRLKFTRQEVRSIRRMENEGGPVGDDDV